MSGVLFVHLGRTAVIGYSPTQSLPCMQENPNACTTLVIVKSRRYIKVLESTRFPLSCWFYFFVLSGVAVEYMFQSLTLSCCCHVFNKYELEECVKPSPFNRLERCGNLEHLVYVV